MGWRKKSKIQKTKRDSPVRPRATEPRPRFGGNRRREGWSSLPCRRAQRLGSATVSVSALSAPGLQARGQPHRGRVEPISTEGSPAARLARNRRAGRGGLPADDHSHASWLVVCNKAPTPPISPGGRRKAAGARAPVRGAQCAGVPRRGREWGRIAAPSRASRAGRPLRRAVRLQRRGHIGGAPLCASHVRREAVVARSGDRMARGPTARADQRLLRNAKTAGRVAARSLARKPPPGEGLPLPKRLG